MCLTLPFKMPFKSEQTFVVEGTLGLKVFSGSQISSYGKYRRIVILQDLFNSPHTHNHIIKLPKNHVLTTLSSMDRVERVDMSKKDTSQNTYLCDDLCSISVTISVRSLFDLCSISVQSLFNLCSISVQSLFNLCSISVRSLFDLCSMIPLSTKISGNETGRVSLTWSVTNMECH